MGAAGRGAARAVIRRVLYVTTMLLAIAAVAFGGVFAYSGWTSPAGPVHVVREYYAALQRGDAATALAYGHLPSGRHDLLTAAVLRQQSRVAAIEAFGVVSQVRTGRSATVTVRYLLGYAAGSQLVVDRVELHESGGAWRMDTSAVPVRITLDRAGRRATLAGEPVPATSTLLFPGAVPIRFDTPYLQLAGGSVSFTGGRQIAARVEVSPAGQAAVTKAVRDALDRCLAAGGAGRCPLPSERYVPGSLRGNLTGSLSSAMTVLVDVDPAGQLQVTGSVAFTGSYRTLDFDNVAATHHGTVQLPLSAVAFPTAPLSLVWTRPS